MTVKDGQSDVPNTPPEGEPGEDDTRMLEYEAKIGEISNDVADLAATVNNLAGMVQEVIAHSGPAGTSGPHQGQHEQQQDIGVPDHDDRRSAGKKDDRRKEGDRTVHLPGLAAGQHAERERPGVGVVLLEAFVG